jgi:hypothetical protein
MNNRIQELAEQAKKYVDDKWSKEGSPLYPDAHYLFIQQRDEKFAELIIEECAKACEPRPWVGLTDDEWSDLYEAHHDKYNLPKQGSPDGMDYERAIEAKLKEKNHD